MTIMRDGFYSHMNSTEQQFDFESTLDTLVYLSLECIICIIYYKSNATRLINITIFEAIRRICRIFFSVFCLCDN